MDDKYIKYKKMEGEKILQIFHAITLVNVALFSYKLNAYSLASYFCIASILFIFLSYACLHYMEMANFYYAECDIETLDQKYNKYAVRLSFATLIFAFFSIISLIYSLLLTFTFLPFTLYSILTIIFALILVGFLYIHYQLN